MKGSEIAKAGLNVAKESAKKAGGETRQRIGGAVRSAAETQTVSRVLEGIKQQPTAERGLDFLSRYKSSVQERLASDKPLTFGDLDRLRQTANRPIEAARNLRARRQPGPQEVPSVSGASEDDKKDFDKALRDAIPNGESPQPAPRAERGDERPPGLPPVPPAPEQPEEEPEGIEPTPAPAEVAHPAEPTRADETPEQKAYNEQDQKLWEDIQQIVQKDLADNPEVSAKLTEALDNMEVQKLLQDVLRNPTDQNQEDLLNALERIHPDLPGYAMLGGITEKHVRNVEREEPERIEFDRFLAQNPEYKTFFDSLPKVDDNPDYYLKRVRNNAHLRAYFMANPDKAQKVFSRALHNPDVAKAVNELAKAGGKGDIPATDLEKAKQDLLNVLRTYVKKENVLKGSAIAMVLLLVLYLGALRGLGKVAG